MQYSTVARRKVWLAESGRSCSLSGRVSPHSRTIHLPPHRCRHTDLCELGSVVGSCQMRVPCFLLQKSGPATAIVSHNNHIKHMWMLDSMHRIGLSASEFIRPSTHFSTEGVSLVGILFEAPSFGLICWLLCSGL